MTPSNQGRKVLVTRFSALGDVAMTLPAVYDACTANPRDRFIFLTRNHPAQVFVNKPANLEVVGVNFDNYNGAAGMWRLARALRKRYGITDYVDLHDVLRTKLLRIFLRLGGVRTAHVDKGRRAKRQLTRSTDKVLVQLQPMHERYRDVFRRAGIPLDEGFDTIWGEDSKGDPALFAAASSPKRAGERWIAMAPFAQHRGKAYPPELLAQVVDELASRPATKVFIFGFGDNERKVIDSLAAGRRNVVNMASASLGIPAELALLSHCDVMLSMDSANMHLASLAGLRTVSIWGATHPYTGFMGWHQKSRDAVQLDMTCRPCSVFGDKPCARGDYHCLAGITPRMILDRIDAV